MFSGLGLIALALGYKVYVDASKEKDGVKFLGQAIGILVMIGAVLVILCGAMKCLSMYGGCPMKMYKGYGSMGAQQTVCPVNK